MIVNVLYDCLSSRKWPHIIFCFNSLIKKFFLLVNFCNSVDIAGFMPPFDVSATTMSFLKSLANWCCKISWQFILLHNIDQRANCHQECFFIHLNNRPRLSLLYNESTRTSHTSRNFEFTHRFLAMLESFICFS